MARGWNFHAVLIDRVWYIISKVVLVSTSLRTRVEKCFLLNLSPPEDLSPDFCPQKDPPRLKPSIRRLNL